MVNAAAKLDPAANRLSQIQIGAASRAGNGQTSVNAALGQRPGAVAIGLVAKPTAYLRRRGQFRKKKSAAARPKARLGFAAFIFRNAGAAVFLCPG
jgi:hypothetical protein